MEGLPFNVTDLGIVAVLAISGLLAFARGFLREILSVGAWVGAAVATIYGLEPARPFLRQYIGEPLLADGITGVVIFVVTLGLLSTLSHMLSRNVRNSALGALDRSFGLLFGLLRGAVVICGLWLVFALFVAQQDRPDWITEARSLPLVEAGAKVILDLLPGAAAEKGAAAVDEAGRQLNQAIEERALRGLTGPAGENGETAPNPPESGSEDGAANPAAPEQGSGYKDRERQDMNRLIQGTQ
jgi:membrane protein required for colicin V production